MRDNPARAASRSWSWRAYLTGMRTIEQIRVKLPYVGRLYRQIGALRHRLASLESNPRVYPVVGSHDATIIGQFRTFLKLLQPHDVTGREKRRVGSPGDGGYVMLDDFGLVRNALSLGVGRDVSWDMDMAAEGMRVWQFDHTVTRSPKRNAQFVFHRKRVVGVPESADDVSLAQILASDALASDRDIIVKMDIEGSEWDALARLEATALERIRQFVVECHNVRLFADNQWRTTALQALQNLAAKHVCIHIHGNNFQPFVVIGGIPFPDAFEATFIRRSDYSTAPSSVSFPTELDQPSNPKRADYYLGRWDY